METQPLGVLVLAVGNHVCRSPYVVLVLFPHRSLQSSASRSSAFAGRAAEWGNLPSTCALRVITVIARYGVRRGSGRSLVLADDDGETQQGATNAPSRRHCLPGEATQAWQCSRTPDSVKTPYGCCSLGHRGTGQAMALGHCNHGVNEHHGRRQRTMPIQF